VKINVEIYIPTYRYLLYNLPIYIYIYICPKASLIVDCTEWTSIIYPHVENSPSL
jgi:hypothetical protein